MPMRNTVLLAAFQHNSVAANSWCASALMRKKRVRSTRFASLGLELKVTLF
jgi:hypothetical protein